jgi:hypothetical protein
MKKCLVAPFVTMDAVASLGISPSAHANDFGKLRAQLSAVRESLITLLISKDKRWALAR